MSYGKKKALYRAASKAAAKTTTSKKTAKASSAPVQLASDEKVELVNRLKRVIQVCADFPAVLAAIVALALLLTKLTGFVSQISAKDIKRDELKEGSRGQKPDTRESAAEAFYSYARLLRSIGKTKKIYELMNLPKISLSKLKTMRYSGFGDKAAEILALVKKYAADLADLEVTPAEITELEVLLGVFQETIAVVDAKQAEGVGATADIETLYKDAGETLDIMKDIVEGKKNKYPEFYNAFMAAMVIHHYGVQHEEETSAPPETPVTPQ